MICQSAEAIAEGLTFRPVGDTIRDTLVWYQTRDANEALKAGLNSDKERALLAQLHSR